MAAGLTRTGNEIAVLFAAAKTEVVEQAESLSSFRLLPGKKPSKQSGHPVF
jgi:hypothetical protein